MEKKKELDLTRRKLQEEINKLKFCWCCGRDDVSLTEHHAIPQRVKNVVFNIKIPICENCQNIIHKDDELIGILKKMLLRK